MARRHDNDGDDEDEPSLPFLGRRGFLTAAGAGAIGGMVGLSGTGRAAQTVIDLGEEGLSDGDNVSPYIDRYWGDGTEVRIPAGSYRYDGSGLDGSRGNCTLVGSEDGVEFHRDSSKIRPTVRCTHGTMRVENITVRGRTPSSANTEGDRWRFEALDPDSVVEIVNVNHPDGSADNSDSNAFLTYDDHRGTLHFKNCYTRGFGNSTFYTNLGYRSGETNPVIVENCTIVDANGAIRGGHNGSQYVDCTFVWRNQPPTWVSGSAVARGIRWDHDGHDNLVENCHFLFESGIGSVGESLDLADQGANTSGVVRDVYIYTESDGAGGITDESGGNWDVQNVHVSGPGNPRIDGTVAGSQAPDLRNESVVWMPESRTVRPGKGGEKREESMFEVVSTDSDAELEYAFTVDGSARKAEASSENSSIGESNDSVSLNGDGTVTVTGVTGNGLGDAFLVGGDVTAFERTAGNSGFRLLLDGQDVTDQLATDSGSVDDGDEEEPTASTFEVVSTDDTAELSYTFTVEGTAEKADAGDGNSSVGESNDTITDNDDGTVTVEGHTGLGIGDAFSVTGEITSFERTGGNSGVQLLLDGQDVTDQYTDGGGSGGSESSTFEVVSTDSDAELEYAFDVDGSARRADAGDGNSSVGESNDTITDNGDGTVTVEGRTGLGFGDAFSVTGEITSFERTGGDSGFQLRLDGQDVTDQLTGDGGSGDGGSGDDGPKRVYVDGTAAPEEVNEYRIEVSGEIQPDAENTTLVDGGLAWDALDDVVDGSTAVGVVGNGVDAYTYTGEVVDLTVEGNATAEVED